MKTKSKRSKYPKYKYVNGVRHELTLIGQDRNYKVVNKDLFNTEKGCYVVVFNSLRQYYGKFSEGFNRRWVNKLLRNNCVRVFRHFKALRFIKESITSDFAVYVAAEKKIISTFKKELGDHAKMLNHTWFEEYVLRTNKFPFNKHNNNKVISKRKMYG